MQNFLHNNVIDVVEPAAAAAQTALESDVVNLSGFQGVTFVALLNDVSDGSVITLTLFHGTLENGSDMEATDIAATFTAGATNADSKALAVEGFNPTKQYAQARLTRTTANAVVGGILAIRHHPKTAPVTQGATVIAADFGAPMVDAT